MSQTAPSLPTPLLYKNIRMLDTAGDAARRLQPASGYAFAAATNTIPLAAEEFFSAQSAYPVVFAGRDAPRPVAVVGLRERENLFVDADGAWAPNAYLPLYVRRYPFVLIDGQDGRLHLGVDDAAARWSETEGTGLFDAGAPSALTTAMLEFCVRFRGQYKIACALGAALREHGLLVEYQFSVTAPGQSHRVTGCQVVAEDRFAALPDEVFLQWRQAGWLPLITAHLLSLRQWEALGRRASERAMPTALAA